MDKYTKILKKESKEKNNTPEYLFNTKYIKIKQVEDWTVLIEDDSICVIPILVNENKILLRTEYIPSYKERDGSDYHLTCISGTVEKFEDYDETIRRELVEEAGIKLNDSYKISNITSVFKSKTGSSKFHYCILPLFKNEYTEVVATTDGSRTEALSKTVMVDAQNINRLNVSDTITKLLLFEAMTYLNIKPNI